MTLAQKILRVLDESPLPVGTPDMVLLTAFGLSYARGRVWMELKKLEAAGMVACDREAGHSRVTEGHGANGRVTLWRLAR